MAQLLGKLKDIARLLRSGMSRLHTLEHAQIQNDARLAALERQQGELTQRIDDLQRYLDALTRSVMAKAADADLQFVRATLHAQIERETGWLRDRVTALGDVLDGLSRTAGAAEALGESGAAETRDAISGNATGTAAAEAAFYPALERQFRGTRAEILARLAVYEEWVRQAPPGRLADLGCGRGEWLELAARWDRPAIGVDLNALMAEQARAHGAQALHADAIGWLRDQPAASLALVTSFHLIEHLPFGLLLTLVEQARRVLVPGGLLILETPNPENLRVATQDFWLDPTHLRPLPPALLEFVLVHAGLPVVATLRLNAAAEATPDAGNPAEAHAPAERSRDYAVIGRKPVPAA